MRLFIIIALLVAAVILAPAHLASQGGAEPYPFRDPNLPDDARITDLISRMTLAEKIECMGMRASVPRLGVVGSPHIEGYHGVAQGGPSNWGQRNPTPTTQFPQAYGLGATWDPGAHSARRRAGGPGSAVPLSERGLQPFRPHRPRAECRSRARPALGAHRGGIRRRPVPCRRARHGVHAGAAGRRPPVLEDRRPAQALPGEQQRGHAQLLLVELRRAPLARVLRVAVRAGGTRRRIAGADGGLQRRERHAGPRASDVA